MAENMYCKNQKANSGDYRDNYDANFRRVIVHPKDCNARIFVKKEDLPQATKDILYPEEKHMAEVERVVKAGLGTPIVIFDKEKAVEEKEQV